MGSNHAWGLRQGWSSPPGPSPRYSRYWHVLFGAPVQWPEQQSLLFWHCAPFGKSGHAVVVVVAGGAVVVVGSTCNVVVVVGPTVVVVNGGAVVAVPTPQNPCVVAPTMQVQVVLRIAH